MEIRTRRVIGLIEQLKDNFESLKNFPFPSTGTKNGLPVFCGIDARKELARRYGIPNSLPKPGAKNPFGNSGTLLYVDDDNGEHIAYWEPTQ